MFERSSFLIKKNFCFFQIILKSFAVLVSAFDLPNGDKRLVGGSLSDPRCILYMKDEPTGKWFEVGRTERIKGLVCFCEKFIPSKYKKNIFLESFFFNVLFKLYKTHLTPNGLLE